MLVTTVIIVDPSLVHENADLVEKGAVWTPAVHKKACLVEKNVNYIKISSIICNMTKKALNFFSAFLLPNLDLNQGPSD